MPKPRSKAGDEAKKGGSAERRAAKTSSPEPGETDAAGRFVKLTVRLNEAAWRQLKIMAMDERTSSHDLVLRAINQLFAKMGKPEIA